MNFPISEYMYVRNCSFFFFFLLDICDELIEYANDEFRRESFFTSPLCNRILGRNAEEVPLDESSERAPLRPNGSSNGNGEARLLDNGFAVVPATESMTMQDFNSPSEHAGIGKKNSLLLFWSTICLIFFKIFFY